MSAAPKGSGAALADRAFELVELAGTYVDDGAPRTAAERLRSAAALLDQWADQLDAVMAEAAA